MPKTRQQKEQMLAELKDKLSKAKAVVFSTFSALSVSDDQDLRRELQEKGVLSGVVKKTILKKALDEAGIDSSGIDGFTSNISASFSPDEVSAAKTLAEFAKGKEKFKLSGGVLEGVWIDEAKVAELSKLSSKDELIARAIGSINAPLSGFVSVIGAVPRNFVQILNAIKDKKT